jgi:hypothetical protein
MRLGRKQASGYVEDTVADPMAGADPIVAEEMTIQAEQRTSTPALEPGIAVG